MIDTVCLLIPKNHMTYVSGVISWELYSRTDQYSKYVRNPTKAEKDTGKYFPRLTSYQRMFTEECVRLEFSPPKLLKLNNLDELEDKDFPLVIETLQARLKTMGVLVLAALLENAVVSTVHFSKNIQLKNGYTVNYLISEMNKVNLRKSFDFARSRYINDGQSLYAHTKCHQLVIYDKVADLGKDKGRAIDKNQTLYQRSLFDEFNKKDEQQEIVRFEVRLNQKQKLNSVLEGLGFKKNPTFKEVFSSQISKAVVTSYWKTLIKERNLGLLSLAPSVKDILQVLFMSDSKLKPKQAIYLLGLYTLAKDENGMRQLRTILSKKSNDRTWYRIAKDVETAGKLITQHRIRDWVVQVDEALEKYEPYKVKVPLEM